MSHESAQSKPSRLSRVRAGCRSTTANIRQGESDMGQREREGNRDATGTGRSVAGQRGVFGPEDFAMRPHMRKFDTEVGDAAAIFVFTHFAIRQSNPRGAELDFRTQFARRIWRDARNNAGLRAGNGVAA